MYVYRSYTIPSFGCRQSSTFFTLRLLLALLLCEQLFFFADSFFSILNRRQRGAKILQQKWCFISEIYNGLLEVFLAWEGVAEGVAMKR